MADVTMSKDHTCDCCQQVVTLTTTTDESNLSKGRSKIAYAPLNWISVHGFHVMLETGFGDGPTTVKMPRTLVCSQACLARTLALMTAKAITATAEHIEEANRG